MAVDVDRIEPTRAEPAEPITSERLLELPPARLDELFRDSRAGPIPVGRGAGRVVAFPGTELSKPLSRALGKVFWQGKVFRPERGDLRNLVSPFGIAAIRAEVFEGESWVDGAPCVVLDYSRSSRVAGWIRDEIREVSPGVYLGVVWGVGRLFGGRRRVLRFALEFPARS